MPIRVLLADDNALFRQGLVSLLGRTTDVEVVGQATDASEVVHKAAVLRPDVVLMDLAMPGGGGVAATQRLLVARPQQVVCMLTSSEQDADLFAAVGAGARGYLVKTLSLDDLWTALHVLAAGGAIVTPSRATHLLAEYGRRTQHRREGPRAVDKLTAREREVLEQVAHGRTNHEIGTQLVIADNTVKVHLRNILDKLGLHNRTHMAAFAVQDGIGTGTSVRPPRG